MNRSSVLDRGWKPTDRGIRTTAIFLTTGLLVACSAAPPTTAARDELSQKAMAEAALDRFKRNPVDFAANASAIIATTGASANARSGAMAEAAIGGQRVTYEAQ